MEQIESSVWKKSCNLFFLGSVLSKLYEISEGFGSFIIFTFLHRASDHVTCPQCPGSPHHPDPVPGLTRQVFRVTPSQTLYLGSHVHSLQGVIPPHPVYWSHGHILHGDTPPRHCTWILMSAISRVTPKTIYMGSHFHSLQGQPLPRHCTLGHKSIVPRVTPPSQNLYPGIWVHSLQGDYISQTLQLGSYVQNLQGVPHPRPWPWGHSSRFQGEPISQPCTCGCTSTLPKVTPALRPCTWFSHPVSRVTPLLRPYTWGHRSTESRLNLSQTLYLWLQVHSLHGNPLPYTVPGVTHSCLQGELGSCIQRLPCDPHPVPCT